MSDLYFIEEIAVADSGPRVGAFTITKGVVRQATKAEALRWALTEECGTCEAQVALDYHLKHTTHLPDGRVLRDGANYVERADYGDAWLDWPTPTESVVIPAEWMEADDE